MPSKSTNSFNPGSLDCGVGLLHHARSSVRRSFSLMEQKQGCSEVSSPCLKQRAFAAGYEDVLYFKYVACIVDGLKVETRDKAATFLG